MLNSAKEEFNIKINDVQTIKVKILLDPRGWGYFNPGVPSEFQNVGLDTALHSRKGLAVSF